MNPLIQSVPHPYTCPHCEIEALVVFRGKAPQLLRACHHAVDAVREGGVPVVQYVADSDDISSRSEDRWIGHR